MATWQEIAQWADGKRYLVFSHRQGEQPEIQTFEQLADALEAYARETSIWGFESLAKIEVIDVSTRDVFDIVLGVTSCEPNEEKAASDDIVAGLNRTVRVDVLHYVREEERDCHAPATVSVVLEKFGRPFEFGEVNAAMLKGWGVQGQDVANISNFEVWMRNVSKLAYGEGLVVGTDKWSRPVPVSFVVDRETGKAYNIHGALIAGYALTGVSINMAEYGLEMAAIVKIRRRDLFIESAEVVALVAAEDFSFVEGES